MKPFLMIVRLTLLNINEQIITIVLLHFSYNITEIQCFELPAPDNGTVTTASQNNSLNHSLGSASTYTCSTGFVLVGQTTRVCEDTNGGTVTTGTWSGSEPTCEGILRLLLIVQCARYSVCNHV